MDQSGNHNTPLLWSMTDRVTFTGLAPELPEDLYHLIKKVDHLLHLGDRITAW
jgi:hypothetical protein